MAERYLLCVFFSVSSVFSVAEISLSHCIINSLRAHFDSHEFDEGTVAFADELRNGFGGIFDECLIEQGALPGVGGIGYIGREIFAGQGGRWGIVAGDVEGEI